MCKVPRRNGNRLAALTLRASCSQTASDQEKNQQIVRFGFHTYHSATLSASFTQVRSLLGNCSFNVASCFLNMHKRMTNRSDTWRLPFLRTSKIELNVCNELELAKHYDALGLHFNEQNNTDCVRTIFYCH